MARWTIQILGLLLCGAVATAQERGTVLGTVKDQAGKPVVGATVTLLSRPIPARTDVGPSDRVQVKTDERGLFRASVKRGRGYTAWAEASASGDKVRLSKIRNQVVPGPTVHLVLGDAVEPMRVQILARGAWKEFEPLTFAMRYAAENVVMVPFELGANDVGVVPPGPSSSTVIVRGKDRRLLHHSLRAKIVNTPDGKRRIVELAEPIRVRVTVVDPDKLPVAGARVWQNPMQTMGGFVPGMYPCHLGTTGKDGTVSTVIPKSLFPSSAQKSKPIFMVEARGYAATQIFHSGGPDCTVVLRRGATLRGRIVNAKGQPVPGMTLLLQRYTLRADTASGMFPFPWESIETDPNGRFEFWGLNDSGYRLVTVTAAHQLRKIGFDLPAGRSTAPLVWLAVGKPVGTKPVDLGDLSPASLSIEDLRIVNWDNSPAAAATVLVKGGYGSRSLRYRADRAGRLLFPLPVGQFEIEAFLPGGGVAHLEHTVIRKKAVGGGGPPVPRRIMLTRPFRVSGFVVDAEGRRVPGARVMTWNRPRGVDRKFADLAFAARSKTSFCDANGNFEIVVPFGDASFQIRAWALLKDGVGSGASVWVDVSKNGKSEVVRVQIGEN